MSIDLSIFDDPTAPDDLLVAAIQHLINTGDAWACDLPIVRMCHAAIESGCCVGKPSPRYERLKQEMLRPARVL